MTPAEQARICAIARSYLDVPWLGHGRSRMGVDCNGLAVVVYNEAGFSVEEGKIDYHGIDPTRLMRVMLSHCRRIEPDEKPEPADIVIYNIPIAGHVGILVDGKMGLNMVHCPSGGRVVEARFDAKRGEIKGIYRWRLSSSPSL